LTGAPRVLDGPGRVPPGASEAHRRDLEALLQLSRSGTHLGLEPLARVLARLGHPERAARAVHVAGSNGKGSTSAFLSAILAAHGLEVGLYTSPHLIRLTERVRFDTRGRTEELAPEALGAALAEVQRVAPGYADLSFFEAVTAAGLVALRARGVDVAVIEAGLGARLDATRLVDAEVAVLTDLSLEHTDVLGETLAEVAREEAAVMRPGRPLVAADGPAEAMAVVEAMARAEGVALERIGRELAVRRRDDGLFDLDLGVRALGGVRLSLLGPHQGRNALLAARAATLLCPEVDDHALREGLASARWPGRMEVVRRADAPPVLLDGAHNAHGAEVLAAALVAHRDLLAGPLHLVFGALADKDSAAMVQALAPRVASVAVAAPPSSRALAPEVLAERFRRLGCPATVEADLGAALAAASSDAAASGGWVVVAGSLNLVGEARLRLLGPDA
jgi:dihydrofolate synthase/folylpolyglutamate synthase